MKKAEDYLKESLHSDAKIEAFAFMKYHEVEDSRWFEPLQVGAKWQRDIIAAICIEAIRQAQADAIDEWYVKLLAKLSRIQCGELSLNDYIAEIETKVATQMKAEL